MDFVQPGVAKMVGITASREVFPIAAVRNVTVMPHCFYDGPGLLAAIRATAPLGSVDAMVEWRYFDLAAQLYGTARVPVNAGSRYRSALVWESIRIRMSFATT